MNKMKYKDLANRVLNIHKTYYGALGMTKHQLDLFQPTKEDLSIDFQVEFKVAYQLAVAAGMNQHFMKPSKIIEEISEIFYMFDDSNLLQQQEERLQEREKEVLNFNLSRTLSTNTPTNPIKKI